MKFKKSLICLTVILGLVTPTSFAWFLDPNKTGTGDYKTDPSVAEGQAAIDAEIKKEAEKCANGEDGTLGGAIKDAQKIHLEMASIKPNIEQLFSIDQDCFSGLSSIYDLSVTIPSLGSIIGAAQDAVVKYAQKKVCTAVKEATSMVTSPINEGIDKINSMAGLGDLNGLANGFVMSGLGKIDPELGSSYNKPPANTTYQSKNGFDTAQVSFPGSSGSVTTPNATNPQQPQLSTPPINPNPATPTQPNARSQSSPSSSGGSSKEMLDKITNNW